jgi:hypothetical protein
MLIYTLYRWNIHVYRILQLFGRCPLHLVGRAVAVVQVCAVGRCNRISLPRAIPDKLSVTFKLDAYHTRTLPAVRVRMHRGTHVPMVQVRAPSGVIGHRAAVRVLVIQIDSAAFATRTVRRAVCRGTSCPLAHVHTAERGKRS